MAQKRKKYPILPLFGLGALGWYFYSRPLFKDDFNRPNQKLGSPWIIYGGDWYVSDNRLSVAASSNVFAIVDVHHNNVIMEGKILQVSMGKFVFRFIDPQNFWSLRTTIDFNSQKVVAGLDKIVGGLETTVTEKSLNYSSLKDNTFVNHHIELKNQNIKLLTDGQPMFEVNDSSLINATKHGFMYGRGFNPNIANYFDDIIIKRN